VQAEAVRVPVPPAGSVRTIVEGGIVFAIEEALIAS